MAALATKAGVEGDRFVVHTPLQHLSKADIVREAARLGLDAGLSWSCYDPAPGNRHCGLCDSCRSEEHTSELQSLMRISYAVFCLKKKKTKSNMNNTSHSQQYDNIAPIKK